MFFESETVSFNILDVLRLQQNNISMFNSGRNFCALSFRFCADTVLRTKTKEYAVGDNYVCYVPARLDYSRISNADDLIVVHFDTSFYNAHSIECFLSENPEPLAALFRKILDCWDKKELGYRYRCSAIFYEILAECYAQNFTPNTKRSKIQSSVEYILENYKNSDLTLRAIADRSFMSEVYFRKLFKEEYGISPQRYIIRLRMQNAVALISTGYYSIKEVAYLSGYRDYKYFATEFKKTIGVSPSEYLYNYS